MFPRLKVSIYDIKVAPPIVLKGSLNYSLYILIYTIGLDYLLIPFLGWCLEYLFVSFTPPLLYRALVALDHYSPCFLVLIPIYKALGKPFSYINLYKEWSMFITLISDTIYLKDMFDSYG